MKLPAIEFEGKVVKPTSGVYRCPFGCGDKRYPAKKWKTERGFRKHMTECWMRPSEVARREEIAHRNNEKLVERKAAALAACPVAIGDTIDYVREIIVKPTHEQRGSRMIKVRYEEVKRFVADRATVREIGYNGFQCVINKHIALSDIEPTREDAERRATDSQRGWNEHVALSERLR